MSDYIDMYSKAFDSESEAQALVDSLRAGGVPAVDGPFQVTTLIENGVDPETQAPFYSVQTDGKWHFNARALELPADSGVWLLGARNSGTLEWLVGEAPTTPFRVFAD